MRNRATPIVVAAVLVCLIPAVAQAQLVPYTQSFEDLIASDTAALGNDGWLVFGNVFDTDGTSYLYGYGTFPAPNDGSGFCAIDQNQGGVDQGFQQLVVYSDYNNQDHALGYIIESNVFQEQIIGPANVGERWLFHFEAKLGNLTGASTAQAFIKTLDPNAGSELTNFITLDMTTTPVTWMGYEMTIDIDSSLNGQVLQFGFLNKATNFVASGIFYDNVGFRFLEPIPVDAPPSTAARGVELRQNYPNPFNPSTQIAFNLDKPGSVEISVYDLAGRRIATLQRGEMGSGEHSVVWDGRTDSGAPVASGQYRYMLKTEDAQVSRSMTLLK